MRTAGVQDQERRREQRTGSLRWPERKHCRQVTPAVKRRKEICSFLLFEQIVAGVLCRRVQKVKGAGFFGRHQQFRVGQFDRWRVPRHRESHTKLKIRGVESAAFALDPLSRLNLIHPFKGWRFLCQHILCLHITVFALALRWRLESADARSIRRRKETRSSAIPASRKSHY